MKIISKVLLFLLLASCVNPKYYKMEKLEPWPTLSINIQYLNVESLQNICKDAIPQNEKNLYVLGCTKIDFYKMICDVYIDSKFEFEENNYVLEHELQHCNGYTHYPYNFKKYHKFWVENPLLFQQKEYN